MSEESEEFLAHYGVKGMKWGVRKSSSGGTKKVSRKERKAEARRQIQANRQDKAKSLTELAIKNNDTVLIKLNGNTVVSGKQFADHMLAGGLLDVKTSRVFATTGGKAEKEAQRINALQV